MSNPTSPTEASEPPILAVVQATSVVLSNRPQLFRLSHHADFQVPLVTVVPVEGGNVPAVSGAVSVTPRLFIGTIDALTAAYRKNLEQNLAAVLQDEKLAPVVDAMTGVWGKLLNHSAEDVGLISPALSDDENVVVPATEPVPVAGPSLALVGE